MAERLPKQPRQYCKATRSEPLEIDITGDPFRRKYLDASVMCECGVNQSQRFGPFFSEHVSFAVPNVQAWQDGIACKRRLPIPSRKQNSSS